MTGMSGVLLTNWLRWIVPEDVKDYAFVFDCVTIQSGQYCNAHGMSNAFFERFRLFCTRIDMHTVSAYQVGSHLPFSHLNTHSHFPETSHHRTFQFLTQVKQNADSVLWTERKFKAANGIGRSSPIFVNKECWTYFVDRLRRNDSFDDDEFTPRAGDRTLRFFSGPKFQGGPIQDKNIYSRS